MNVSEINRLLARGEIDRDDLWPRIIEYESKAAPFHFEFGLNELPQEPGVILIRGPRQYGKSTWLDLNLRDSIYHFGKGCAYYLNGDAIPSSEALYAELVRLSQGFAKSAQVRRIFVDEITAVTDWERAVKRAVDEGALRNVLLITTGSRATDLRRGAERLPGRKGKLQQTNYIFLPISYAQFEAYAGKVFGEQCPWAYALGGGSPLGCNDIYQFERVPDYWIQLVRDWVEGEVVRTGRNRFSLSAIFQCLFRFGGTPVGFAKLARESGLANNTIASEYMEQLADLMCVLPAWPVDYEKQIFLQRKPCKFQFINLSAAMAFHPHAPRYVHELTGLSKPQQAQLVEWIVAQEIWRRAVLKDVHTAERIGFWQSSRHEIDFVCPDGSLVEVKLGKAGPLDFGWFKPAFLHQRLTVVCSTPFETDHIRGVTLADFLLGKDLQ